MRTFYHHLPECEYKNRVAYGDIPTWHHRASVAGDGQVRVFDAEHALLSTERSSKFTERQTCIRVLKCHKKRTKRIITEESPDAFLTVAEACMH